MRIYSTIQCCNANNDAALHRHGDDDAGLTHADLPGTVEIRPEPDGSPSRGDDPDPRRDAGVVVGTKDVKGKDAAGIGRRPRERRRQDGPHVLGALVVVPQPGRAKPVGGEGGPEVPELREQSLQARPCRRGVGRGSRSCHKQENKPKKNEHKGENTFSVRRYPLAENTGRGGRGDSTRGAHVPLR